MPPRTRPGGQGARARETWCATPSRFGDRGSGHRHPVHPLRRGSRFPWTPPLDLVAQATTTTLAGAHHRNAGDQGGAWVDGGLPRGQRRRRRRKEPPVSIRSIVTGPRPGTPVTSTGRTRRSGMPLRQAGAQSVSMGLKSATERSWARSRGFSQIVRRASRKARLRPGVTAPPHAHRMGDPNRMTFPSGSVTEPSRLPYSSFRGPSTTRPACLHSSATRSASWQWR